jgi:hypothetical protein
MITEVVKDLGSSMLTRRPWRIEKCVGTEPVLLVP